MTGAASADLGVALGTDHPCCGRDDNDESGGCGRCLLVRNPTAVHNLTAVVMKKSYCPPSNSLCTAGKLHIDIAVPGFDFVSVSDAQICGSPVRMINLLSLLSLLSSLMLL